MEPDGAGWSFWDWACVESLFFVESRRAKRKNGIFGLLAGRRVQIFLARAGRSQSLVNQKSRKIESERDRAFTFDLRKSDLHAITTSPSHLPPSISSTVIVLPSIVVIVVIVVVPVAAIIAVEKLVSGIVIISILENIDLLPQLSTKFNIISSHSPFLLSHFPLPSLSSPSIVVVPIAAILFGNSEKAKLSRFCSSSLWNSSRLSTYQHH